MNLKQVTTVFFVVIMVTSMVIGYSFGPPYPATGAPGEFLCTLCHSGNPVNSPGGLLTITSSSSQYFRGDTLEIRIDLARTGGRIWGFEATAISDTNARIGTILDTSSFTQLYFSTSNGRQYAAHNTMGNFGGVQDSSPGWAFLWVAPLSAQGPVAFYAAGNAGNANGDNSGDFIYTTSLTVTQLPCCLGGVGNIDCDQAESVDIADLTRLVDHLFLTFVPLCCDVEANVDGIPGVDIGDLTQLVDHLFLSFQPLPSCP